MTSPLPLPDWVPWWVHLAILLVILFLGLMLVLMPFSVFGTKSRLEAIEVRLDEIQAELRNLAIRPPDPLYHDAEEEVRVRARPVPYPPPARAVVPPLPARPPSSRGRTEPRIY